MRIGGIHQGRAAEGCPPLPDAVVRCAIAADGRPVQGRLISGITTVDGMDIRVIGACIPWSFSHVNTGQRDRQRWREHIAYIDGLRPYLDEFCRSRLSVILGGDFNQTFPPSRIDPAAHEALTGLLDDYGFEVATADMEGGLRNLNHIAVRGLELIERECWSNMAGEVVLTDHAGVAVEVTSCQRLLFSQKVSTDWASSPNATKPVN